MGIQDMLREVADTYDASAGSYRDVVGQQVLRGVASRSDLALPSPLRAKGYGGRTTPAATPWIGVFDPRINDKPGKGLYLAYIFSADLRTVSLTLQQSITYLEQRLGRGLARQVHLRRNAARLRTALERQRRIGWTDEPELRHNAERPRAYEAASVISRCYEAAQLPSEADLKDDLAHAAQLLERVHEVDLSWWSQDAADFAAAGYSSSVHAAASEDPLAGFHPKDSSDYIANIAARQQVKKRSHEKLIDSFGMFVVERGFTPTTHLMHPKDLVLHRTEDSESVGEEWLVEAKVVRRGNPTEAVRQAVGQLFEYSHFLYQEKRRPEPHLVGLFAEGIGGYSRYLEKHGIASIWQDGDEWGGSPLAGEWGIIG
ncbi:DUF3578 domain-containing protein [Streptomyces sp. JV176]|uniref:MrcB family domain-containing protein n=1 Tax=Streptomyces sp. JV176 TaxID=858630 RepID=UPI002E77C290|nr:DUF3578 domain-containing protein [Streptomyces sp. JV176]MEE1802401.1 DUF3578 domain-containing protein [Streptomyces sp. JV176]